MPQSKYSVEVRVILTTLIPGVSFWQYTDEQVIQIFEVLIRELHEQTDEESNLKRKLLYLSKAWHLREVDIVLSIMLTAPCFPALRMFTLHRTFALLGRTADLSRWCQPVESYWDDDSYQFGPEE